MVYDKLPINVSRLNTYFPELTRIYNKNIPVNDKELIYHAEITLDIEDEEKEAFEQRYIQLMNKFEVSNDGYSYADIIYICQKTLYELELMLDIISLDPQTLNALDFLIGYQELVKEVDAKKALNKEGYKSNQEDAIIIQIKDRHSNGSVPLFYDGSGRLIAKMIYKAFKTTFNNTSLRHILENYDDIPSATVLKQFITPNIQKKELLAKEMLSDTAFILSSYFKNYIPKGTLSRKKNLFIYELFYLFNILQYVGKVKGLDSKDLKRTHLNINYTLPLLTDKHSAFITEFIKNANRRNKPLSGAIVTFT